MRVVRNGKNVPHQIKVCLCDLTGQLLDNLAATTACQRCCQRLDFLAERRIRANCNRQAVAQRVAPTAEGNLSRPQLTRLVAKAPCRFDRTYSPFKKL